MKCAIIVIYTRYRDYQKEVVIHFPGSGLKEIPAAFWVGIWIGMNATGGVGDSKNDILCGKQGMSKNTQMWKFKAYYKNCKEFSITADEIWGSTQ